MANIRDEIFREDFISENALKQKIWCGDCLNRISKDIRSGSIDVVVTSPPYNLKIKYHTYRDDLPRKDYLNWLSKVFQSVKRVLKENGSFFLNIGSSNCDPWLSLDVASVARKFFVLQNRIMWIKSITLNGTTYGHYKPINSDRFLNNTFEEIFHFTKTGKVKIDRLANGVPYADKSNIKRWKKNQGEKDVKCRGNVWFIQYKTIKSRIDKNNHPAIFPPVLAEMCIKMHGIKDKMKILDPFAGIGSTLMATKKLGLIGIGIEKDEEYVEVIRNRVKFEQV